MRLWHQALIPQLPDKQLGGQWCEIRMILGTIAKHGKVNHSTVNYVNNYSISYLFRYGYLVYLEREMRDMHSDTQFANEYRDAAWEYSRGLASRNYNDLIYPEHNDAYLEECILNLEGKGIHLRDKIKEVKQ